MSFVFLRRYFLQIDKAKHGILFWKYSKIKYIPSSTEFRQKNLFLFFFDVSRKISDGHRRTSSLFGDIFVLIIFAHSKPFSQGLALFDLNDWDFVLSGKAFDYFDVVGFIAVLSEDNIFSSEFFIFSLNSLADFMNSLCE